MTKINQMGNLINKSREFACMGFASGGFSGESPNSSGVVFYWVLSGETPGVDVRGIWRDSGVWDSTAVWLR